MAISSIVANAEEFIKLPPEDRAWVLISEAGGAFAKNLNIHNLLLPGAGHVLDGYPAEQHAAVTAAYRGAWQWLQNTDYLMPEGSSPDFLQLSPQGIEWYQGHPRTVSRQVAEFLPGGSLPFARGRGITKELVALLGHAMVLNKRFTPDFELSFGSILLAFLVAGDPLSRWFQDYVKEAKINLDLILKSTMIAPGEFNEIRRSSTADEEGIALLVARKPRLSWSRSAQAVFEEAANLAGRTAPKGAPLDVRHVMGACIYKPTQNLIQLEGWGFARQDWSSAFLTWLTPDFRGELAQWITIHLEVFGRSPNLPHKVQSESETPPPTSEEAASAQIATSMDYLKTAADLREAPAQTRRPSLRMLADAPLDNDAADRLGFKAYARALAGLINNPDTSTPLTLAINGPWGAGKTTLALMVQRILKRAPAAGGTRPHVTCWFNAWMHDDAPSLASAFAAEIAQTANRARSWWKRFINPIPASLLPISRRRSWLTFLFVLVALLLVFCATEYWHWAGVSRLLLSIAALLGITAVTMVQPLRAIVTFAQSLAEFVKDPKGAASSASMKEVSDQLRELIEQATPTGSKFVIFIDDLERCRPPRPLDILEVVNQLLCHKGLVTVIVGDMPAVAACAAMKYRDLVRYYYAPGLDSSDVANNERRYGREYLQKIVQLQLDLPVQSQQNIHTLMEGLVAEAPPGAKAVVPSRAPALPRIREILSRLWARRPDIDAARRSIDAKIDEELRSGKEDLSKVEESLIDSLLSRSTTDIIVEDLISERIQRRLSDEAELTRLMKDARVVDYVQPLPRHAKRLLNRLRLLLYVAHERTMFGGDPPLRPEHLAKWAVLCERWPDLAEGLVLHPRLMMALEQLRGDDNEEKYTNVLKNLAPACVGDVWLPSFLRAPDTEATPGVRLAPVMQQIVRFEPAHSDPSLLRNREG